MMALLQRETTGKGQWVHTSLLEAMIFMLDFQAARWLMKGDVPGQAGNNHPTGMPTGVYPTADGHINIAAAGDNLWRRCCKTLGLEALVDDPHYVSPNQRSKNRDSLNEKLAAATRTRTSAEWIEKLNEAGVPCGPINSIDETFAEPQVKHLGIATKVNHPELGAFEIVGQPMNMTSLARATELRPAPNPGQHTDEILASIGYDTADITALRKAGKV